MNPDDTTQKVMNFFVFDLHYLLSPSSSISPSLNITVIITLLSVLPINGFSHFLSGREKKTNLKTNERNYPTNFCLIPEKMVQGKYTIRKEKDN